jgi:hypothetical protein
MSDRPPGDERDDFDPGLSFADEPLAEVDAAELPAWLRNFAESASDDAPLASSIPAMQTPAESVAVQTPPVARDDDDPLFPGWLDAPRPGRANAPGSLAETVGPSFFSEDDLPEWLRALSSDQSEAQQRPAFDGGAPSSNHVNATAPIPAPAPDVLYVPAVAPVWVTDDNLSDSQGATLFAVIAQGAAERPDVLVSESPAASRAIAASAATADQGGATAKRERPADGSWTRRERVLMVLVIVMTVVMFLILGVDVRG